MSDAVRPSFLIEASFSSSSIDMTSSTMADTREPHGLPQNRSRPRTEAALSGGSRGFTGEPRPAETDAFPLGHFPR